MKKTTARKISVGCGVTLFIFALTAFLPGFGFHLGSPRVIAVGKTSDESKQDFVMAVGGLVTKYEINYGTIADPCWGPEGFSTIKGYPYFRVGTFELYAWLVP
jgi:hypothetical protein